MKSRGAQASIAIVCMILGIMLAVQFRTNARDPSTIAGDRWNDLTVQVENLRQERDALAEEVISLREKLQKAAASHPGADSALDEELNKASIMAGLVPVQGKGVIVTLDDSPRPLQQGDDPNLYLIHAEDILKVVNELKVAGAEAISVNEERIVGSSEITCAGNTILVNVHKIASPFVIKAIGDPDTLKSGLDIKGGYLETLRLWGYPVQVKREELLQIPAYKGAVKFDYAKPNKE